jgi:hypothetical protein
MLPVENLDGEDVELEFFLVPGSGTLLLGNTLLHKAVVDGPEDHIEFIDAKGLRVVTPTFFDGVRTRLSIVTTRGDLWNALLRMRPLSISYAEGFLVFSCGEVEYDKHGYRNDRRKTRVLGMTDSGIQRCQTRPRWNA